MTAFSDLYGQFGRPAIDHMFGEQVTYTARRTDDAGDEAEIDYVIASASRWDLNLTAQPLGFATDRASTLIWSLPKSSLDAESVTPARGDSITDSSGDVYAIVRWKLTGQGTIYEFEVEKGAA